MYLLGGTQSVIDEAARRPIGISRTQHCRPCQWIYAPQRRRIQVVDAINAARPDILGSDWEPRLSKSLPCAIVIGCAGLA